jgi:hypothetical protein
LLRFVLARIRADEHWLCRVDHHIISDAWSWQLYFRELAQVYEAKKRGEPPPLPDSAPLQYADYAVWQRRTLDSAGPAYRASVEWWRDLLSGQPREIPLPFRRRWRRRAAEPAEGLLWWGVDSEISQRLDQLGRATGVTYFTLRLAAFVALLAAEGGQSDVVLGTYVTNRNRVETQNMFGYFANLALLRLHYDARRTFLGWTAEVRKMVGDIQAHGEIPYEQLREELRACGVNPPEIRAIFSVTDQVPTVRLGEAELTWLDRRIESMPWGFTVAFDPQNEEHRCRVSFDARLFDPARVRDWVGRFGRLLDAVSREPDLPIGKLVARSESLPATKRGGLLQRFF